jgi:hypothetical protein
MGVEAVTTCSTIIRECPAKEFTQSLSFASFGNMNCDRFSFTFLPNESPLSASFLCALPPSLRASWAATYARLSLPGSLLITLQFPLDDVRTNGPPYSLSRSLYRDLLDPEWEEIWSRDAEEDESVGPFAGSAFRKGRERVAVWKRRQGDLQRERNGHRGE